MGVVVVFVLNFRCFVFADMPWYQQKIASVVFATPPTSSYKEVITLSSLILLIIGCCMLVALHTS